MKKVGIWVAASWRSLLISFAAIGIVIFLLWFGLGNLLPGFSDNEIAQRGASSTYRAIIDNPLGLPHKTIQLVFHYFDHTGPFAMRTASAVIGFMAVISFYYILYNWYDRRVAMLGTLLFASSAWFLHFARLGTQDILYVLPVVSVAATVWLQNSKGSAPAVLTSAAIVITLLYIPGMIWFVVPAVLWQIGRIGRMLEGQKVAFLTILTLLVVLALTPIGWAFYQHHELVRTYFGVPAALPQPVEFIKNVLNVPLQLFWKGPNNPEIWLARLPLLDWFSMAMLVIGTYALFKRRKLDRTWFIVFMVVIGSVLASVGGPVKLTIILPFVYLLVAGGIAQMLRQWFSVFPRNPFARSTGAILMTVAILMSAYYNVSHYFIAWPNTEETQKVFHNKP